MNIPENCALEALKAAMPLREAERMADECARRAIQELESYNQKYMAETPWFDDGNILRFVPMDTKEIEPAVQRLSRTFLILLHRRGLIGS
jgi:hypothetical protein